MSKTDIEEIKEYIDESLKKFQAKFDKKIDDMAIKVEGIHVIHADVVSMMTGFREFFQKSTTLFGADSPATKVAAKKTTRKKKDTIDTIRDLGFQEVDRPTKYNSFVSLVKGDDDFASMLAKAWAKVDKTIINDPYTIDYIKFYETFLSKKREVTKAEKDKDIANIIEIVEDRFAADKASK